MPCGTLIVSLDFELYWGMQDVCDLREYRDNLLGVWNAVPELLEIFRQNGVHATWAAVGFLFADSSRTLAQYMPPAELRPGYENMCRSAYRCLETEDVETESKCFFAPELIGMISKVPGQEIGCHTFSHYYCLEEGQTLPQFEADMKAALHIAEDNHRLLKSLVLPRNQCKREYIDRLREFGFSSYRSRERDWIHRLLKRGRLMKIVRLMDVYFPLTGSGAYVPQKESGIWNFPGSRMYKPFFKPLFFLERLKVRRIKRQMLYAAKHNLVFHLWWHPHNIGARTDFHLKQLREIFSFYRHLREKYAMRSLNMAEAVDCFDAYSRK